MGDWVFFVYQYVTEHRVINWFFFFLMNLASQENGNNCVYSLNYFWISRACIRSDFSSESQRVLWAGGAGLSVSAPDAELGVQRIHVTC